LKRWLWRLFVLAFLLAVAAAAGAWWAWDRLNQPYQGYEGTQVVEVRPGQGAGEILASLKAAGVLLDTQLARTYLIYALADPPLQAGEYVFEKPLATPEVLAKLIRGEVVVYPMTLIEGLTLVESAEMMAGQGFGERQAFEREMRLTDRIEDLDPEASTLEGYLYPDTYHFARGTSEAEIVSTLVRTFRQRFATLETGDERSVRDIVTLASIVEKEALLDEERPLIAGLYAHRLRRGIALYADPTVIFAKKLLGTWDGNLRRVDLKLDSPYNTYRYPGLPPGPICSPAVASLAAAVAPTETTFLYFVSRNDGSHVFAETLNEHNRNVERWQRAYWRKRWAEERRGR
jgi:UPF0755 protein